ncbi:MAG: N-acetylmuramoyl-L-alanine amidase [Spirochaetaceae bacterium]|jgi:hypothetical protein|nr:N-acetylmuramoyl-L-alanine amidase [Spirochaetaceae bacterium]
MKVIDMILNENDYPHGRKLTKKLAVLLHGTGVGGQAASGAWDYFEHKPVERKKYAPAYYCIDLDGAVYRFLPDDDAAYYYGSSANYRASGKIYRDWARKFFGKYGENPERNSPDNAAATAEMRPVDNGWYFSPEALRPAAELTVYLCKTYQIPVERTGAHHLAACWKGCSRCGRGALANSRNSKKSKRTIKLLNR